MEFNKNILNINSVEFNVIEILEREIGLTNLNELKDEIDKEIGNGNKNIGIDLKNIQVINSSGLGILISCQNKLKSVNGSLKLLNPSDKVFNIFKITKLNLVFDILNL